MAATVPYQGRFCVCGLQESNAAWDAGTVGCPECNAVWPDALVRGRHPSDGKPEVHVYARTPTPPPYTFAASCPFAPGPAWIVVREPCVLLELPCVVCDGTGKVGGTVKVNCPGQKGGAPLPCHHGKTRKVEDRWVALPAKIHTVSATWASVLDGNGGGYGVVTLFVRYSGGVDRNTDRVIERYHHSGPECRDRDSDESDRPYLCTTEGKARRIALARNEREDEDR